MSKSTKRTLLKVVSIIFIILGGYEAAVLCIGSLPGLLASLVTLHLGGLILDILSLAFGLIGAVFMLIAGITGLNAANRKGSAKTCRSFAIIILVLSIASLVVSVLSSGLSWTAIAGIILPVLYYIGAKSI